MTRLRQEHEFRRTRSPASPDHSAPVTPLRIDEFELDDLIHRYKRAARKLWTSCGSSGSQWLQAATTLEYMRDRGEEHDWWADSERSRDRS